MSKEPITENTTNSEPKSKMISDWNRMLFVSVGMKAEKQVTTKLVRTRNPAKIA